MAKKQGARKSTTKTSKSKKPTPKKSLSKSSKPKRSRPKAAKRRRAEPVGKRAATSGRPKSSPPKKVARARGRAAQTVEYGIPFFLTAENDTSPAYEIDGTPHPRTVQSYRFESAHIMEFEEQDGKILYKVKRLKTAAG